MQKQYDWPQIVAELNDLLRLKAAPTGLKFLKDRNELKTISRLEMPDQNAQFTACQLVGSATRRQVTVGIVKENLVGTQCKTVLGLLDHEESLKDTFMTGVWFEEDAESLKHQAAMYRVPAEYDAVVAWPLKAGVFDEPDVCMIYANPQQIMLLGNAVQYYGFSVLNATFVGESACSDSWAKAFVTGSFCMTIPCYGERKYGGVPDDEMIAAFPPTYIGDILKGLRQLRKNGIKYPAPFYGTQLDARFGLAAKYGAILDPIS